MEQVASLSELFPSQQQTKTVGKKQDELGQEDFMKLMVTQMKNQDPTKPMDNFQFLSQIAQFGTVNGIQDLQTGISSLVASVNASQTLQASTLVGRSVVSNTNIGRLGADEQQGLGATVDAKSGALNARLLVQDASGALVYSQDLGHLGKGNNTIEWDGKNGAGDRLPAGDYRISVEGMVAGQRQALTVKAHNRVDSITVDGGTVSLNLDIGKTIDVKDVKEIL